MGISRPLGLHSTAQISTNKEVFRMIEAYHIFNETVANSSILVPMAHEMLKHEWNLQHDPTISSQNWWVNLSIMLHKAHQTLKQWHRKLCRSIQQEAIQHYTGLQKRNTMNTERRTYAILQFGPSHRKADQAIAIMLQLSIVSAIPMPFQHLGPHAVLFWVLNFKPHSSTKQYPGFRANEEASGEDNDADELCFGALFRDLGR